jgi:hypothetical protein
LWEKWTKGEGKILELLPSHFCLVIIIVVMHDVIVLSMLEDL